jgi:hypothetical protein
MAALPHSRSFAGDRSSIGVIPGPLVQALV